VPGCKSTAVISIFWYTHFHYKNHVSWLLLVLTVGICIVVARLTWTWVADYISKWYWFTQMLMITCPSNWLDLAWLRAVCFCQASCHEAKPPLLLIAWFYVYFSANSLLEWLFVLYMYVLLRCFAVWSWQEGQNWHWLPREKWNSMCSFEPRWNTHCFGWSCWQC